MSGSSFQNLLRRADTCRRIESDPYRTEWWGGYIRGLRRAHYGDGYGTERDHEIWLSLAGNSDRMRDARGRGYLAGLTLTMLDPS